MPDCEKLVFVSNVLQILRQELHAENCLDEAVTELCLSCIDDVAKCDDIDGGRTRIRVETLLALANDNINAIDFHTVDRKWLRLYTDSSLLYGLLELSIVARTGENRRWQKAIRQLDLSIIIAGAIGNYRMDWIQTSIQLLQPGRDAVAPQSKELQPVRVTNVTRNLLYAPLPVPVLPTYPTIEKYITQHRETPFILRDFINSHSDICQPWRAIDKWQSGEYLLDIVGEGRVVPVEVGQAYDEEGWGQRIISFRDFLAHAGFGVEGHRGDVPLYLAQHPLLRQFPQLERDIVLPDYVWSSPSPTSDVPDYHGPDTEDGLSINVWVGSGNGNIISPAHTDPYYNCYAQVVGQKRIWLAPPSAASFMSPHGLTDDDEDIAGTYMKNTSTIPILKCDDNFMDLKSVFPEFFNNVYNQSLEAVLGPGDMLIMPPGWWHAMRAEGSSPAWSVSIWY